MIWIISGTQDGREIGARLADWMQKQPEDHRADILMTVVSQYGKILAEHEGITIEVGRFAREDMLRGIREKHITCILDCSHPYAAIVSETARAACKEAGIAYVRYERPGIALPAYDKLHLVSNEEEAAALAGRLGDSILLTTGSKTLPVFVRAEALQGKTLWARVLPLSSVIRMCEELGLKARQIIAMQGPFSYEMNRAMIRDFRADVLVTKNSGLVGGIDTKLKAAMDEGIHVIVIERPEASLGGAPVFSSQEQVLKYMEEHHEFY